MKLKQVENIIKNEVLKIKGNNYNYEFVMNEILYCALDEVDYNSKQITENLLLEITKLYFEIQDKEKQIKMSLITDIYTNQQYRNKGYGKEIVEKLLKLSINENVYLISKEHNLEFYKKCGFEIVKEIYV